MRYGNVKYILKKKGSTIGVETEIDGRRYNISTEQLATGQFRFNNAIVDRNGYVRAIVGNLPKKEYVPHRRETRNTENSNIEAGASKSIQIVHERCTCLIKVGDGSEKEYIILIEDSESGYTLYSAIVLYWIKKHSSDIPSMSVRFVSSRGKGNIIRILEQYGNREDILGCLVIMDKLGEHSGSDSINSLMIDICSLLETMPFRAGLFAPLSAEFVISTYKFLHDDLVKGNCIMPDKVWFLNYLRRAMYEYERTSFVRYDARLNRYSYIGGIYEGYVLNQINQSGGTRVLPSIEKQIYHILNIGLANTHYAYKKSKLSSCFYTRCCSVRRLKDVPGKGGKCGELGFSKDKMSEWLSNSCIKYLDNILCNVLIGSNTRLDENTVNIVCKFYEGI